MYLIVVRHGQPENQDENGDGDPPLSALGLAQAEAVGQRLAQEEIHHVVASPMQRAHQTGLPYVALTGMEIEFDDDLKECGWNAGPYRRSEENLPQLIQEMSSDPESMFRPEGKAAFQERILRSFARIASEHQGQTVVVFCHGMVMNMLVGAALDRDPMELGLNPTYTSITRVQSSSDSTQRRIVSFNETGHLQGLS